MKLGFTSGKLSGTKEVKKSESRIMDNNGTKETKKLELKIMDNASAIVKGKQIKK